MEVHQMLGRAGRPRYDPVGEAWVLCKGTDGWQVADEVSERYFFGPIEDISSNFLLNQQCVCISCPALQRVDCSIEIPLVLL